MQTTNAISDGFIISGKRYQEASGNYQAANMQSDQRLCIASSQVALRQISIKQVNAAGSEGVTRTRKHDVNISV